MSALQSPLFTKKFTGGETFTLTSEDGIKTYSILLISGTATLTGTAKIGNLSSDAIDLQVGVAFNGGSQNQACCFTLVVGGGSEVHLAASRD